MFGKTNLIFLLGVAACVLLASWAMPGLMMKTPSNSKPSVQQYSPKSVDQWPVTLTSNQSVTNDRNLKATHVVTNGPMQP